MSVVEFRTTNRTTGEDDIWHMEGNGDIYDLAELFGCACPLKQYAAAAERAATWETFKVWCESEGIKLRHDDPRSRLASEQLTWAFMTWLENHHGYKNFEVDHSPI